MSKNNIESSERTEVFAIREEQSDKIKNISKEITIKNVLRIP